MNALFHGGPYFDVRTKDCLEFTLLAEKEITARWDDGRSPDFERYLIPAHVGSDGASLPLMAQAMRPGLRERMFGASLAHDSAYRKTLLVMRDGMWLNANLSKDDADQLIKALMFIEAVTDDEREIVYQALKLFGGRAYEDDRAKAI